MLNLTVQLLNKTTNTQLMSFLERLESARVCVCVGVCAGGLVRGDAVKMSQLNLITIALTQAQLAKNDDNTNVQT